MKKSSQATNYNSQPLENYEVAAAGRSGIHM